jgi:two-component system NtrC family sensor kinase
MALSFAVSQELSPLIGILDKALATITANEAATIRARWMEVDEPPFWEKPFYRNLAAGLLVVLFSCMAMVLFWNRSLNTRVQERTRQLEDAQIQLIQAEKMESVGRLSAGVAHEVKNPLAIIQMGVDYLSQVIPAELGAQEVMADMDDAVHRADRVIKGLLDFSHSNKLSLTTGDLNALIEDTLRMVAHEYQQRNIDIQTQLSPSNPSIKMDANKIQQVLINMLINAAQAVDQDGKVTVSCQVENFLDSDRRSPFEADAAILRLCILDNGPGISAEDLDKLFDPFFTTKPVGEGTGLGLSVSRNIIELHGGRLDIRNAPEGGAMITIDFKLETEDTA